MSLRDELDALKHRVARLLGVVQWPTPPIVFAGPTELPSATPEEIEEYGKAEAEAAKVPRTPSGGGKPQLVPHRPLICIRFVRPDGHGGAWPEDRKWSPEAQAQYDEEYRKKERGGTT